MKSPKAPITAPPLLVKVALPAVAEALNSMEPPAVFRTVPPLLVKVPLAAVVVS